MSGDMFGMGATIGGLFGGFSSGMQTSADKDIAAAQTSKAWRRAMFASNTAYTRAVQDLKNAGLNPLLAYTSLGGASSPHMSPMGSHSTAPDVMGGIERGIAAERSWKSAKDAIATIRANRGKAEAEEETARNFANVSKERAHHEVANIIAQSLAHDQAAYESNARRDLLKEQELRTRVERQLGETDLPRARAIMRLDESEFGENLRRMDRITDSAGRVIDLGGRFLNRAIRGGAPERRRGEIERTTESISRPRGAQRSRRGLER